MLAGNKLNTSNLLKLIYFERFFHKNLCNLLKKEQIGELEVYCDFGIAADGSQDPDGCPDIIQLKDRKSK